MKEGTLELCLQFDPFPVLTTERLVLRSFLPKDAQALLDMRTNDRVMKYLGRDKMKDLGEAISFIQKVKDDAENGKSIEWALTLKGADILIGKLGFWRIILQHQRAELGYNLTPNYFGKGIMSEAVTAVLQYGFEKMKLHSVEANLDPKNRKSVQLLSRNGFVKEGHFKESYFYGGSFSDTGSYSLLRSEWNKNKI
jgi:ribosomal-protein-alanine N-acetyltransferase